MSIADDYIAAHEPWLTGDYETFEVLERTNLVTNPKAGAHVTTGWTNSGLTTFAAVTLGAGGVPAPSAEMKALGLGTAFHAIANTVNDRAYFPIAVEQGHKYRFSMYVYLDSTAGSGMDLHVRDETGVTVLLDGPNFTTLDTWTRLDVEFVADVTGTRRFAPRSLSTASDWFFTGVLIEQSDSLHPYFDGDISLDAKWVGSEQASRSELYTVGDRLRDFLRSIGQMFEEVELYAFDTDEFEGWTILLDVDRAPVAALPYLAQYVGERLPVGLTEDAQREWIKDAPNQVRGTVTAIVRAAQRRLTDPRLVTVIERDGGADKLTVVTYTSQTPDENLVLDELETVVPADISLTYVTSAGQIWSQVVVTNATWAAITEPTWADLMAATPEGTYGR